MLTSVLWTRPNTEKLLQLRRSRVKIQWGDNRSTRCPEVVIAILANPAISDPIGAVFATRVRNLRTRVQR